MDGTFPTLDLTSTGTWLTGARIFGLTLAAYLAVLWVALIMWTWRDIRARTNDSSAQLASVALVGVFFVPGLLLYMALRPQEMLTDAYNRKLEEQAFLQEIQKQEACPDCRRAVDANFIACPYCRAQLRSECESCGEFLSPKWVACPYCSAERRTAAVTTLPAQRAQQGQRPQPLRPERPRPLIPQI